MAKKKKDLFLGKINDAQIGIKCNNLFCVCVYVSVRMHACAKCVYKDLPPSFFLVFVFVLLWHSFSINHKKNDF